MRRLRPLLMVLVPVTLSGHAGMAAGVTHTTAVRASPQTSLAAAHDDRRVRIATGETTPDARTNVHNDDRAAKKDAVDALLRHAYTVYLGLRACSELSTEQNDKSFLPSVSLEEARATLKLIDAAAAEVGIDSNAAWVAASPRGVVTAESLKTDPAKNVENCRRMGGFFRIDVGNMQPLFQSLGAKTTILTKDY